MVRALNRPGRARTVAEESIEDPEHFDVLEHAPASVRWWPPGGSYGPMRAGWTARGPPANSVSDAASAQPWRSADLVSSIQFDAF